MTYMTSQDHESDANEQRLAELVRRGGARVQPPEAARQAVRAAVFAEWQNVVAARSRRRRAIFSLAAAAAVAGLAVWLAVPLLQAPAATVAGMVRVTGPVEVIGDGLFGRSAPARAGGVVTTGDEIRTGAGGRLALQVGELSLRLDQNSTIAMVAADRVELRRGAVYIDSGFAAAGASPLLVATPFGSVRHLGTQYETRLVDGALRVRVREGVVRIERDGASADGAAGEQLTVLVDGAIRRGAIGRTGGEWAWVGEIAPQYDLENRSLADFLRWVGRETGREIAFSSPASEAEAARVMLRGSTAGLLPERAMGAVLSTTQLGYREQGDRLLIDFRTGEAR